jgi:hypothetical protein
MQACHAADGGRAAVSATDASHGNPLHRQAFYQGSFVIRDGVLLEALYELASIGLASMVLFAVVDVSIFLTAPTWMTRTWGTYL